MRFTRRWLVSVSLVAGAWLFLSPWILGYTGVAVAAWTSYVLGAAIVAAGLWALTAKEPRVPDLVVAVLGALALVAPWVLVYTSERAARIDAWIVGAVVMLAGLGAALEERPAARPERRGPAT